MLIKIRKSRLAKVVVFLMVITMFFPMSFIPAVFALSGGPTPPEFASFQTVGSGDLVDPFTGNVQYSVPLLTIGGYPVNLTYSGDINPEQNAGWVGLGWSLQAGSIGRAMRGLPDDFKGDDIKKEVNVKPRIIQSYNFQYHNKDGKQLELVGLNGGVKTKGLPTIVHDNYRGFGINYDVNMKFGSFGKIDSILSDTLTGYLKLGDSVLRDSVRKFIKTDTFKRKDLPIMDFNTHYSSYDGNSYQVIPQVGFIETGVNKLLGDKGKKFNVLLGNPSIRFNTHTGLQSIGMETGYGHVQGKLSTGVTANFGANFLTKSYIPNFNPDMHASVWNTALALSGDKIFSDSRGMSVQVVVSTEKLSSKEVTKNGYGCLYMSEGEEADDALLDHQSAAIFVDKYTQKLAPTVSTYDVFNISASGVGGNFKVKYNSLGIISPPSHKLSTVTNPKIVAQLGGGTNWEIAGDFGLRHVLKKTGKWESKNEAAEHLEYKKMVVNDVFEPHAMRNNFEFIESNTDYQNAIGGKEATKFGLKRGYKDKLSAWRATNDLYDIDNQIIHSVTDDIVSEDRDPRMQSISYLTADEAEQHGVVKKIQNYHFSKNQILCESLYQVATNDISGTDYSLAYEEIDRDFDYRKGHHISEINVLQPDGMLYNFGLPTYQKEQKEVSFSVDGTGSGRSLDNYLSGNTSYTHSVSNSDDGVDNTEGIDNHYQEITTPAYANAFLLTSVLSGDYSDLTNDGPTTDDIGNYVKFNYSMPDYETAKADSEDPSYDPDHHLFDWRTPYGDANWSRGYVSDELDDRGSFSYGKREQWYMHSIETKSEIVIFELSDRADGYESAGRHGGINSSASGNQQKYLTEIKIYNRKEFEKEGSQARPKRTILLHYSHDLCKGIPSFVDPYAPPASCGTTPSHPLSDFDNTAYGSLTKYEGGKLTLNKLEFIDGELGMVTKQPFIFEYKTNNPDYVFKSVDRWGTYHPIDLHKKTGVWDQDQTTLADHPYTNQTKANMDLWASSWMLSNITLPSGGELSLEYESDDYAYVQDKRAMSMVQVTGIRKTLSSPSDYTLYGDDETNGLAGIKLKDVKKPNLYILFEKEVGHIAADYVPDGDLIYFSFNVDLAKRGEASAYEQVSGFFTVEEYGDIGSDGYIKIKPYDIGKRRSSKVNPVTKMAWQYAFSNLPHLMNPKGNTVRSKGAEKIEDAVNQAVGVIPEYIKSLTGEAAYYQALGHAQEVNLDKSFVRLMNPDKIKLGGGHRVKKVTRIDHWAKMTGNAEPSASYATDYEYVTSKDNGLTNYSSGVAIYEPFVGGDENPFKMPINYEALKDMYIKRRGGAIGPVTISYDLGPIGEEFFPSPGVGYSKVTTQMVVPNANIVRHKTGRTEYEFHTAYDFPTKSSMTTIDKRRRVFSTPGLGFDGEIDSISRDRTEVKSDGTTKDTTMTGKFKFGLDLIVKLGYAAASQGFIIERNNMHGKSKSVKMFKPGVKDPVSQATYHYKIDDKGELVNVVNVLKPDGTFGQAEMGVQMDPTVYANRTTEVNQDGAIAPNLNIGSPMPVPIIPSIMGSYAMYSNDSRIMILTKQVYRNGILSYVEHIDEGSVSYTKNLAWDGTTGQVLLSETEDEFDNKIYSLGKPAYWMNPALAGAYENIGLTVQLQQSGSDWTDPSGELQIGDVLVKSNFSDNLKYWVLDKVGNVVTLIDAAGYPVSPNGLELQVFRSGHKNLLNAGAETVTLYTNPLNSTTGRWDDSYDKVVSVSAQDYNDIRHMMYKYEYCAEPQCTLSNANTVSEDLTMFGFGYLNPPASYQSDFNYAYENLNFNKDLATYYAKPQNCSCSPSSAPPPPEGQTASVLPSGCEICSGPPYYEPNWLINPFVYGLRGIWQRSTDLAYYEKRDQYAQRTQVQDNPADRNSTDISQSGFLQDFKPYWEYNTTSNHWERNSTRGLNNPWIWKDSVTKTDFFGNTLESVSVVNDKRTSVLYDYERRRPVAFAKNASYHEVLFDGFEDYSTDAFVELNCNNSDSLVNDTYGIVVMPSWQKEICEAYRHWKVGEILIGGVNRISDQERHTGNHSLMLGPGVSEINLLNTNIGQSSTPRTHPISTFTLQENDFARNFYLKPDNTEDFIISFWAKEAYDNQVELRLTELSGAVPNLLALTEESSPVEVNGWIKRTYRFTLAAGNQLQEMHFEVRNKVGENPIPCYIDDIMIHPADALLEATIYDRNKGRMMSSLNANNFATFFEYDKTGKMVRKKVETDRGIMTYGEARQSYKK